jgi:sugar (pentulose or hexulose) kinase
MLAAAGCGWFDQAEEAGEAWIDVEKEFLPDPLREELYAAWLERYFRACPDLIS